MNFKKIVNFFFELDQSRFLKHAGWYLIRIKDPKSLAEHTYRASIIAFVLANLEGKDSYKLATATLFHDLHELRILDHHKVSSNYLKVFHDVKDKVRKHQISLLDKKSQESTRLLLKLSDNEKIIIKDADQLETALTAKEYFNDGHKKAIVWIERISQVLQTKSAKILIKKIVGTDPDDWWKNLKEPPVVYKTKYARRV